ncbi:enoyl-CoA hydratase/isomerase family protein [Labrys monachus]|uniref:Enoyl-CoA hydratase/carnithine racemase n=1 Tax=Labrys monachus TaxID=217067 RepID=A0ABU0FBG3_9HYPH|nr:enoyl-CoA hydratase-related protein [Labrys monachus]MDQ0391428.1 enoyl-CoA hydratase/carnithine racemase [Labrys monachus]
MTENPASLVILEKPEPGIGVLTLNRPEKLNALSTGLLAAFAAALDEAERDAGIRVLILTGAGEKAFAAGADIAEYQGRKEKAFMDFQFGGRRLNDRLEALTKPTIAAVNGYALGGGFEIVLCCDVIVVSTSARLGLPEGLLGLSPGGGGTQRLIRSLGRHVTADLLLTAGRLKGERAFQLGLAAALCEPENLLRTALEKARAMLKLGPLALGEMKRLVRLGADAALPTALAFEQEVLFRLYCSGDGQEGIDAFLEKRSPTFKGI